MTLNTIKGFLIVFIISSLLAGALVFYHKHDALVRENQQLQTEQQVQNQAIEDWKIAADIESKKLAEEQKEKSILARKYEEMAKQILLRPESRSCEDAIREGAIEGAKLKP